jgi:hypothetical protein
VLRDGSSATESRSSQGQTRLRSESLANDEAKPNAGKSPEEVVAEQDKVSKAKTETGTEAGVSLR